MKPGPVSLDGHGRRFLLVGGSGFFGARLAESLDGTVVVTQRTSAPERETWARAHGIQVVPYDSGQGGLEVRGDFDAIVHLASPGAAEAARDPAAARDHARRAALDCLAFLRAGRAGRMLHFSTFHVYGAADRPIFRETDAFTPVHPYGRIHAECETLVNAEPHTIVVRPSNLVGAPAHAALGDQAKLMFLDLCRQATSGAMRLHNDGLSYRDFLPFEDAISAVRILLESPMTDHRVFHLACGRSRRLDQTAAMIRQLAGATTLEFGTGTDAFRSPFSIEVSRLQSLGWEPRASLEEETRRILTFFGGRQSTTPVSIDRCDA